MKEGKPGRPQKYEDPPKRFTLYMSKEYQKKLNELYAFRIMTNSRETRSDILCKALSILYDIEFKKR